MSHCSFTPSKIGSVKRNKTIPFRDGQLMWYNIKKIVRMKQQGKEKGGGNVGE
jgi:hypothetical protein